MMGLMDTARADGEEDLAPPRGLVLGWPQDTAHVAQRTLRATVHESFRFLDVTGSRTPRGDRRREAPQLSTAGRSGDEEK